MFPLPQLCQEGGGFEEGGDGGIRCFPGARGYPDFI